MTEVIIYANGSSSIGLGHIMRTSALGEKLKDLGFNVSYLTDKSDEVTINLIEDKAFKVTKIDNIISFLFRGNINFIMKKISEIEITNLWIEEPDLEEIFMHYYAKED